MCYRCAQAVLLLVTVVGCGPSPGDSAPSAPEASPRVQPGGSRAPEQAAAQTSRAVAATPAAQQQVVIDNFAFSPREITVAPGTRVTWVNRDDVPHTATSNVKPRMFDSGALDTDATFSFVFKAPGTYAYFCAVHPHMTGKVIVK